jgi:NhaA family Na+:H+ antiporter
MEANSAPTRLTPPVGEHDHVKGLAKAPITLVEYGDYECPYCGRAHPIIEALQEQLGDELRYVFRHFPIASVHPHARLAAEAAEAAGAQGQFWAMHDYLFEHQEALDKTHLVQYAADLGLDVARFERELTAHLYADRVREDFRSGRQSGVSGTPTFFINGMRYDGPWDLESLLEAIERPPAVRIRQLTQEFVRLAASGGIVLLICTVIALLWANSPWRESYVRLWETDLTFVLGRLRLSEHLLGWINDGLMVIFFLVVGLEIKRELTTGELASRKRAALPIVAALGGMVTPALFYTLFNVGGPSMPGWGVPVATDIAFTLGILTLLGRRVPFSLRVFFAALAIADDLGAILVIALFYTTYISWVSLAVGAGFLLGLVALNRARVYTPLPYALLGIGLWLAFLESGIHPTIAGVLLAMTIPTRSPANLAALLAQCVTVMDEFDEPPQQSHSDSRRQAIVQTLETITERMLSPAQQLERGLQPWTTFLILPLFALANAGVSLGVEVIPNLFSRVSLGIIAGLVLGKPLGITLFTWLAIRFGLADMPAGIRWPQFVSASCLAGIGFTMSLFIAGAAFEDPAMLAAAKLGILVASTLAALIGWVLLSRTSPSPEETTQLEPAMAIG